MSLHRVFDAAYPPQTAPPGCDGVLGYIGGGRAAHVWTLAEWQRFGTLRQFPAYVPDFNVQQPIPAAEDAAGRMKLAGWAPFQPDRRVIVCDLETLIERGWYQQFAAEIEQQGFCAVAYGSESTIFETAAAEVWLAAWDGDALLPPGQTVHAHQYQGPTTFGGQWSVDFGSVDEW